MLQRSGLLGVLLLVGCGGHGDPGGAVCKAGRITYDGAPVVLSHVLMAQWGMPGGSGVLGVGYEVQLANHAKVTCDMMRVIHRRITIDDGDLALDLHIFATGETGFRAGLDLGFAWAPQPADHLVRTRIEKVPVNVGDTGTICVPEPVKFEPEMFDGKHHTFTIEGSFSGTFCGARAD
jgi:hypothetical protein